MSVEVDYINSKLLESLSENKKDAYSDDMAMRSALADAHRLVSVVLGRKSSSFNLRNREILYAIREVAEMKQKLESMEDMSSSSSNATTLKEKLNNILSSLRAVKKESPGSPKKKGLSTPKKKGMSSKLVKKSQSVKKGVKKVLSVKKMKGTDVSSTKRPFLSGAFRVFTGCMNLEDNLPYQDCSRLEESISPKSSTTTTTTFSNDLTSSSTVFLTESRGSGSWDIRTCPTEDTSDSISFAAFSPPVTPESCDEQTTDIETGLSTDVETGLSPTQSMGISMSKSFDLSIHSGDDPQIETTTQGIINNPKAIIFSNSKQQGKSCSSVFPLGIISDSIELSDIHEALSPMESTGPVNGFSAFRCSPDEKSVDNDIEDLETIPTDTNVEVEIKEPLDESECEGVHNIKFDDEDSVNKIPYCFTDDIEEDKCETQQIQSAKIASSTQQGPHSFNVPYLLVTLLVSTFLLFISSSQMDKSMMPYLVDLLEPTVQAAETHLPLGVRNLLFNSWL